MATKIDSYLGQVYLLGNNPRTIRDNAFNRLCQSIERDETYLKARGIVVWLVPQIIPIEAGQKSPFLGQEGKLVVLGGNQRTKALLALGKKELRKDWVIEAKDDDGNWWSPEQAERFVLMDNGGEGISGENDYRQMIKSFSLESMKLTGIDFSNLRELMSQEEQPVAKTPKETAEEGEHGEKNPALAQFIKNREQTRKDLKEIDDTGFYLLVVFDSFEEKAEFISKAKLTGKNKRVRVNGSEYLVLVFESYAQKMDFIKKAGLQNDDDGEGELEVAYGMFCDGRALAKSMGIELKESGLHFRNRVVDNGLAAMAREDAPQMSEGEQEEAQFAEAKRKAEEGDAEEDEPIGEEASEVNDDDAGFMGDETGFDDDLPPVDVEGDEEFPASDEQELLGVEGGDGFAGEDEPNDNKGGLKKEGKKKSTATSPKKDPSKQKAGKTSKGKSKPSDKPNVGEGRSVSKPIAKKGAADFAETTSTKRRKKTLKERLEDFVN